MDDHDAGVDRPVNEKTAERLDFRHGETQRGFGSRDHLKAEQHGVQKIAGGSGNPRHPGFHFLEEGSPAVCGSTGIETEFPRLVPSQIESTGNHPAKSLAEALKDESTILLTRCLSITGSVGPRLAIDEPDKVPEP